MADKKYYWLKLQDDFFGTKEMKKLRKIAGGDTYTVIYLKMQLLSLKDSGKLFFEGVEDTFYQEIALAIDEEEDNVKFTIMFLQKYGLIEEASEDQFLLPETMKSIGVEGASAARVRKHRDKTKSLQCNTPVTICNTEIDIELDKDKEIDTYVDETSSSTRERIPYSEIIRLYNSLCPSLPKVQTVNDNRKKAMAKQWKQVRGDIREFEELFRQAEESDFLAGRSKDWQANFDWLMKPTYFTKVLEGTYCNRQRESAVVAGIRRFLENADE